MGESNMIWYTYIHIRSDDKKVFYVGKGCGRRAWKVSSRSKYWSHVSDKHGVIVEIAANWCTEHEAFEHEKFLIACMRDMDMPLVNMTNGGDGFSGGRHTQEYKDRLRNEMLDKDRQLRMASANRGRKLSKEHREKLIGRVFSDEHKRKIALANIRVKRSDAAREAMRKAATGRKQSKETIAKRMASCAATRALSCHP